MTRPAKTPASSNRAVPIKSRKPPPAKSQAPGRKVRSARTAGESRARSVQKPPTAKTAKSAVATKQSRLIELLLQPAGAKLTDLVDATGWQAHSVRGVISGILRKKLGLIIDSQTNENGIRMYRIHPAAGAGK